MTRNVGDSEAAVRWITAALLIGAAFFADLAPGWNMVAFFFGLGAMLTAIVRYCPFNTVLGRNRREPS